MRKSLTVIDNSQGVVIYRGPSVINGKSIVVVVTGLQVNSGNVKTGTMVQVYIIRDRMNPYEALRTGEDEAICGDCPHRRVNGAGTCYVNPVHGPAPVYRAFQRGMYSYCSPEAAALLVAGRMIRLGAYGDPAAVPIAVWDAFLTTAGGWTGYTHQWRRSYAQGLKRYCMASVETERSANYAHRKGWRTFRIREDENDELLAGEIVCPASNEAGKRLTCQECKACSGGSSKKASVAIIAHGTNWKRLRLGKVVRALKQKKRLRYVKA